MGEVGWWVASAAWVCIRFLVYTCTVKPLYWGHPEMSPQTTLSCIACITCVYMSILLDRARPSTLCHNSYYPIYVLVHCYITSEVDWAANHTATTDPYLIVVFSLRGHYSGSEKPYNYLLIIYSYFIHDIHFVVTVQYYAHTELR